MQAKGLIKFFTIALVIVCIYQLLFTVATKRVESKAEAYAESRIKNLEGVIPIDSLHQLKIKYKSRYLDSVSGETALNLLIAEYTYNECKERELNLGLDLQGGMSVVLEVSVEDVILGLANHSQDPTFRKALEMAKEMQKQGQGDFVTYFGQAFEQLNPQGRLATIFATPENKDLGIDFNTSNEEVLRILAQEARDAIDRTYNIIRTRIDAYGVSQPNINLQPGTGRIIVELPGVDNPERVRKLLQSTAKLEFWETYENAEVISYFIQANKVLAELQGMTRDTIENTMPAEEEEEIGSIEAVEDTAEIDTSAFGSIEGDTIEEVSDTGTLSQAEFAKRNPLFAVLQLAYDQERQQPLEGPIVGYARAADMETVNRYLSMEKVRAVFPKNIKFLWSAKPIDEAGQFYALYAIKMRPNDPEAPLTGEVITNARQDYDQDGRPSIEMTMNAEGASVWKRLTGENVGRSIAIVLDDLVYSAPVVQTEIAGGRSQITGNFEIKEAQLLANILKAGKLPAPARIVEEQVVGPTLGAESIRAGLTSLILGLVLVLIFMVVYYSTAGLVSDLVLLTNLFFIIGVLASFGAALTLPGMAGIVLTIGMAVDANVIIYERIKEEIRKGKGPRLALVDGYKNSYSAIIDANITTLITGFILLYFGLGPVKGFATVLVIGIFTSFLTAVLISRLIFDRFLEKDKPVKFYTKLTQDAFSKLNINFIPKRKKFYLLSGVVLIIGISSIIFKGFELGVDFQGGRSYVIRFDQPVNTSDMKEKLKDILGSYPVVKTFGAANQVQITTSYLLDEEGRAVDSTVLATIYQGVKDYFQNQPEFPEFLAKNVMSSMKVQSTIADDIKQSAIWATIFSFLGIFLYILVRFGRWQYSTGALSALLHDVFIVLGIFSLFGGILPWSMEIDQTFIAAILTIIGYSINDTVVVFDRVREFLNLHPTTDFKTNVNNAINSTLSRTLMTSFTTLIVVIVLAIFGGEVIRGFAFALFVGIFVGTYSSIFIATPIAVDLIERKKK